MDNTRQSLHYVSPFLFSHPAAIISFVHLLPFFGVRPFLLYHCLQETFEPLEIVYKIISIHYDFLFQSYLGQNNYHFPKPFELSFLTLKILLVTLSLSILSTCSYIYNPLFFIKSTTHSVC